MSRGRPIASYDRIVVLTGAGISVASGLRPYRGPGGLWEEEGQQELATLARLRTHSADVWRFFARAQRQIRQAAPNEAHRALARFEAGLRPGASLTLVTQNIDGLHQAAGSRNVVELHGSLERARCSQDECAESRSPRPLEMTDDPPSCPGCGAPLRPDIVLFDEPLPGDAEWRAKRALRDCDLFLAVGTSGTVSPASNFVRSAEYAGARTLYVNVAPLNPPVEAFQEEHIGPAEEVLPRLLE